MWGELECDAWVIIGQQKNDTMWKRVNKIPTVCGNLGPLVETLSRGVGGKIIGGNSRVRHACCLHWCLIKENVGPRMRV